MIISVASGKGGTGKTFLATNLTRIIAGKPVNVLDCDVEEPNDHLFLQPKNRKVSDVFIKIPEVDQDKCIHCGKCSEVCAYRAITDLGTTVLVFPQMCHGCGACSLACPVDAITEVNHKVGELFEGDVAEECHHAWGMLTIGEVAAPHIIREVKERIDKEAINVIDAPPGTSCAAVAAVSDTDFCILVTEPTPFGLCDLELAIEMLDRMGIKHGVVINRDGIGDDRVECFCKEKGVPVLGKIPHDREIAQVYSSGALAVDRVDWLRKILDDIYTAVKEAVSNAG